MEFTLGLGVLTGGSGTFRKSLNTMIRRACFWCAQDRRGMGSGFALFCRSLKLSMPTHYWSLAFILFAVRTDFWNTRSVLEIRCSFRMAGCVNFRRMPDQRATKTSATWCERRDDVQKLAACRSLYFCPSFSQSVVFCRLLLTQHVGLRCLQLWPWVSARSLRRQQRNSWLFGLLCGQWPWGWWGRQWSWPTPLSLRGREDVESCRVRNLVTNLLRSWMSLPPRTS